MRSDTSTPLRWRARRPNAAGRSLTRRPRTSRRRMEDSNDKGFSGWILVIEVDHGSVAAALLDEARAGATRPTITELARRAGIAPPDPLPQPPRRRHRLPHPRRPTARGDTTTTQAHTTPARAGRQAAAGQRGTPAAPRPLRGTHPAPDRREQPAEQAVGTAQQRHQHLPPPAATRRQAVSSTQRLIVLCVQTAEALPANGSASDVRV